MPLRVAIPDMVSPSYFPAIAAVELGFMREQGLDATIELIFPVTRTYEELRDGHVDYVGGSAHAPLYAFKNWEGCKLIGALAQKMYWFLIMRRDLKAARGDLNCVHGLRIGAAPGPVDGLKRMLVLAGIDPLKDVTIGPVPGTAGAGVSFGVAAAKALEEGKIDGFWANGMGAEVAVRNGVGTLVLDARRGDGPAGAVDFTFPGLVTTAARVSGDPAQVEATVRALVAAHHALKANPAIATQAAARLFPPAETALIAELIRRDAPFYDASISSATVTAMNAFARDMGLLTAPSTYEQVVATEMAPLWTT